VMANDGTKSDVDRTNLQKEFVQMQDEIVAITDGTSAKAMFNGNALFQDLEEIIQVGPDGAQSFTSVKINLQKAEATINVGGSTWANLVDKALGTAVKIGDQTSAGSAVGVVAAGIDRVSGIRADVGAQMKRMEHTLDGLRTYEENIGATESRIRDVDIAKETSEMSKYSILQQIGTAVMAQANQVPKGVLVLLE
jgi:flagellin